MSRFPLKMITGPEHHGYELDGRQIFWEANEAQPWLVVPCEDGTELLIRVANPAFNINPAPSSRRNPLMKRAALAFFAPLMEGDSG